MGPSTPCTGGGSRAKSSPPLTSPWPTTTTYSQIQLTPNKFLLQTNIEKIVVVCFKKWFYYIDFVPVAHTRATTQKSAFRLRSYIFFCSEIYLEFHVLKR